MGSLCVLGELPTPTSVINVMKNFLIYGSYGYTGQLIVDLAKESVIAADRLAGRGIEETLRLRRNERGAGC